MTGAERSQRALRALWTTAVLVLLTCAAAPVAVDRSYEKFLTDENGTRLVKLTVTYLGKAPKGEFQWQGRVDRKLEELDFYTLRWENLTGVPIEFVQATWRKEFPSRSKKFRTDPGGRKEILLESSVFTQNYRQTPREGGNTIEPHGSQVEENYFYGIDEALEYNVLYIETTFQYRGRQYTLPWHVLGTRNERGR